VKNSNNENNKISFIGKIKASFSGRKFKSGAYATILSAVVIVIVVVVNLIISKMDIQMDLSTDSKFSLTTETKDMIKGLKDDITIYYMVQQGHEVNEFEKIANQYDKLSNKITIVKKDPVLYPNFASQYISDKISENSFIVVDNTNSRAKYIDQNDMVVQEMDYQTYQPKVTGTDAEGKITSAILYVTSENLPNMYVVQGHNEPELPTTVSDAMSKMNVNVKTLSTVTQGSIPEDCNILYINSPEKDFNDAETKMIKDYLSTGGKAIITADYNSNKLTNFLSILDYYGIKMVDGIVVEGNQDMHEYNYPSALLPTINSQDETSKINGKSNPVIMLNASGLAISDTKRSSLTINPLLTTSTSSYSKTNLKSTTIEKEDGDVAGPFYLGLAAKDTYNGVTSEVVVFSSELTFSDETSSYGNPSLLAGTVGALTGNASTLTIPAKKYGETYIVASEFQAIMWGVVAFFIIPLVIFATGSVICLRRRKK
jgi:ABC-2 type transport system permease protein